MSSTPVPFAGNPLAAQEATVQDLRLAEALGYARSTDIRKLIKRHAASLEWTQGGAGKAIVLGIVERNGELRTAVVSDLKVKTVQTIVRENVAKGSTLMTDEHGAYTGLGRDYMHHTVNHGAGEYVRSNWLHTNSIESVWAILKRQIIGIHHWVSPKHLSRYAAEMTWRFNNRQLTVTDRMNAIFSGMEGRLRYKVLIA